MNINQQPSLFGLTSSNRDFSLENSWGKNQFNNSFPVALCCYIHSQGLKSNYLGINSGCFNISEISIPDVFGINPLDKDIYFAFESIHTPFQKYVIDSLPRTDLVIQRKSDGYCLTGLEIKLTALPDNTTCELDESNYGSEIVVRPDTIVYLACSIAQNLGQKLNQLLPLDIEINDWTESDQVLPHIQKIIKILQNIAIELENKQSPFLIQPIWKTIGKSSKLAENCLDVFAWSNAGFIYFISQIADNNPQAKKITRQTRTAIWLYKMLSDIKCNGRFNHLQIIDELSYNTKNDKAFASAGNITNKYMSSPRLIQPLITKQEIKNIILGGGQNLLSPERRFDAIIVNSPELF
ncbi:HindVP family restriction endonuclease [Cyanobacterium aponinum FACHB-4101]|uniref:HindVP family restriction endonuclease n=1 Tax=Cyanobacterium aponinum TaxID=379064 RepID=UPI0016811124|nr:HindVP family restriction endonuclease [Cyanobacterium aponinum]MBD2394629.1 HindVP family restriction endonuclease [Cyanobacterium aponinum FACHB-4101]